MSVICFAALKGGVGKTTLSINVAHAFARRGCRTVLIDLDPSAHATAIFKLGSRTDYLLSDRPPAAVKIEASLARLFLSRDLSNNQGFQPSALQSAVYNLRPYFDLIPSGPELRHMLWGRGAKAFATFFPSLIEDLRTEYDHIVIDTPPDFNILTRNAIAAADLAVVPVDSSEMSINSLEEIIESSQHIKGPVWAIARTMVSRQAKTVHELSQEQLQSRFEIRDPQEEDGEELLSSGIEDAQTFINMLYSHEQRASSIGRSENTTADRSPIYLLHAMVSRTEQQNKLTFLGRTAFDSRATGKLADQYLSLAKELEDVIAFTEGETLEMGNSDLLLSASIPG